MVDHVFDNADVFVSPLIYRQIGDNSGGRFVDNRDSDDSKDSAQCLLWSHCPNERDNPDRCTNAEENPASGRQQAILAGGLAAQQRNCSQPDPNSY